MDVQRRRRHRQHTTLSTEQARHPVKALDMAAQQLPQRHDEQVAGSVVVQLSLAREAMLQDSGPGSPPLVVTAERGQCHPQVAWRQHTQLPAQATARPAVVGDGDDGREPTADPTQCGQRRSQAVSTAEGYDCGTRQSTGLIRAGHSRPRSRWTTMVSTPCLRSRAARASLIATLRCFPPVQPTPTVTNRLPSRR